MSEAAASRRSGPDAPSRDALRLSAQFWFAPALIGNWFFAYHVAATYLVPALGGDFSAWTKKLFVGLVKGDPVGNGALAVHLAIAFVVSVAGPLQLIPAIRARAPMFHRWNGRIFIATGVLTSLAALYMVATRDTFGPDRLEVAVSLNAVLIIVFAVVALRRAMAQDFVSHRRWALRAFLAMSGVWYLRVMYAFLNAVSGGDIPGVDDVMGGPTNLVLAYASFLLPLAGLEGYFLAERSRSASVRMAAATALFLAAAATAVGVYGTIIRWLS